MNPGKILSILTLLAISGAACTTEPRTAKVTKKQYQERVTASDQSNTRDSDVDVTRRIRDRLTDDDKLSLSAQNITIVTLEDHITLKGEVRNAREKERVLSHARRIKGTREIHSQLTYTE